MATTTTSEMVRNTEEIVDVSLPIICLLENIVIKVESFYWEIYQGLQLAVPSPIRIGSLLSMLETL
jgi:hypothetical protein